MHLRNFGKKFPYPIKQGFKYAWGILPLSIRYGKVFRDTYRFLQKSQWWSKEDLAKYQMEQLYKILHHAYDNVPYYRRVFDERRLKPEDIQSFDDLKKLPYLTKRIVRDNASDLIGQNYPNSKLSFVSTGGSTGIPLNLYWEKGITDTKEWAFVWRQWNWAGYKFGERRCILRGDVINRFERGKRGWWEYDPLENALVLSSRDMSYKNIPLYVKKICEFNPAAIQGYPSSLIILANYLRRNNLKIKNIKSILTSSENLYHYQRELIEKYFCTNIFDHYGNTERNTLIMQCEKGNYHIISEYGIVELIGKEGELLNKEDEMGEITATGFNNYAMPFIRYKTEDFAVYSKQKCLCGRNYPLVKKIEGRAQDFIVLKDNQLISLTAIQCDKLIENNFVREFQFYQDKPGEVGVYIVTSRDYSEIEKTSILKSLIKGVEQDIRFYIKQVENIQKTQEGKCRLLIQKLTINLTP